MRVRKDSELKSVEFADASCVAAPSSEAPTNALFWPLIEVTMPWSAELRAFEMSSVLALKLLKLAFAGPSAHPDEDGITLTGADGRRQRADRLIEAWLPAPTATRTADPLLRSLREQGWARPWCFADGTESDAVDVRPADGALIGADGQASPSLFSVGVPHEDIRVFTIIAPVPGTNSSVLREADAAAHAALSFASTRKEA